MNAAFLLVTTAWFAGAEAPAPAAKPVTPAPAMAAPATAAPVVSTADANCGGSCGGCGGCDTCCESGHSLFGRLKGLFHHGSDCGCESSCGCAAAPAAPACNTCNTCDTCGGGHKLFSHHKESCGCEATTSCGGCGDCCESGHGHGFFSRLKGHFHHGCESDCGCDSGCGCGGAAYGTVAGAAPAMIPAPATGPKVEPIPAPKEPAKKMPSDKPTRKTELLTPPALDNVTPKSTLSVEPETKSPFELRRQYESRVGHAADYSWVTGQLFYVHADGGLWILRYAPLWQEDANGGSLVLARDLRMDTYREGDLVTVHGEIINQKSSVFVGGPLYQAQSIQLVDRLAR